MAEKQSGGLFFGGEESPVTRTKIFRIGPLGLVRKFLFVCITGLEKGGFFAEKMPTFRWTVGMPVGV